MGVKISDLTEDTNPADNDWIETEDVSANASKKVTRTNFFANPPLGNGAVLNKHLKPTVVFTNKSADESGIAGTIIDVVTATAITPDVTSSVIITATFHIEGTTTDEQFTLFIREGSTTLDSATIHIVRGSNRLLLPLMHKLTGVSAASHTYKLSIQRVSGTGSATCYAAGTSIKVEYFAE